MTPANQLFQLLSGIPNLILHLLPGHPTVRNPSVPDMLRLLAEQQVLISKSRNPLLILPHQVRDIPHSHGEKRPGGNGAECQRRRSAEEDTPVPGYNRPGHGGDNGIDAAREETLARVRGGSERCDGVGEGVFDVEGAREEGVEAVLGGEGVGVQEETSLSNLGG